jgi:N-acyl amino acid synthase of PEP-CTERM/exosortase system
MQIVDWTSFPPPAGPTGSAAVGVSTLERRPRLLELYDNYFETLSVETEDQLRAAFRLRYEVYCLEHPFEDPAKSPYGMEVDHYDADALHAVLRHRASSEIVGAVRLILPRREEREIRLPIRDLCRHELIARDNGTIPRAHTAEISRFAVSKSFRRRTNDEPPAGALTTADLNLRRHIPNTSLGLMQAVAAMAATAGVTHLCAVMEPTLLRMLRRLGIHFVPLGPLVEYHGRRQPCYAHIDTMGAMSWLERPEVWQLLTRDGTIWPLNMEVVESLRSNATHSTARMMTAGAA